MIHIAVRVELTCPEDPKHTLGAIGRQVVGVPGSPAGSEPVVDIGGLVVVEAPDGSRKIRGVCETCHKRGSRREPERRWDWVREQLDHAQRTENGIYRVELRD